MNIHTTSLLRQRPEPAPRAQARAGWHPRLHHFIVCVIVLLLGGWSPAWAGPTTTSLSSSSTTVLVGQNFTLTATVSGTNPTGNVTFKNGASTLGTQALTGSGNTRTAVLTTNLLLSGTKSLTAVYAGDTGNTTSTSSVVSVVVNKNTPVLTLTSSVNPSTVGQATSLQATVSGYNPNGTITFLDGTTAIGTAPLSGSGNTRTATLSYAFTTAGSKSLTFTFPTDTANSAGTSAPLTQTVNSSSPVATTTALASSANPAGVGASVTFTASVTGASPTGTVSFLDGGTSISTGTLSGTGNTRTAQFSTSSLSAGTHAITASYAGDPSNQGSTSTAVQQVIGTVSTTTAVASSKNPALVGETITLTATVTGSNPTGAVTFFNGSNSLGSQNLSGTGNTRTAQLATSFNLALNRSITATYAGDTGNAGSTSSALSLSVVKNTPTLALTSSVNPTTTAQATTLVASVTGFTPNGTVTFLDGATSIGSVGLSGTGNTRTASLTYTFSTAGSKSLSFTFPGDNGNFAGSSPPITQTVNPVVAPTSTVLSASQSTLDKGRLLALTATVSGSNPTGQVSFADGGTPIGMAPVLNGKAVLTTATLATGAHSLVASYPGDSGNQPSSSASVAINVSDVTATVIQLEHNPADRLTRVIDPRNLPTTYTPDGLGQTRTQSSPDTGLSKMTYDAVGSLRTVQTARNKTTTYSYDALRRVTLIDYQTGIDSVFEYDGGSAPYPGAKGRLTKITDESGQTVYTFDARSRLQSKAVTAGTRSFIVTYHWGETGSAVDKLIGITYPSGSKVVYGYDTAGLVNSVIVNPVNANGVGTNTGVTLPLLASLSYDGESRITGWSWSDGTPRTISYDGFGQVMGYSLGKVDGTGPSAGLLRVIERDDAGLITGYKHYNAAGALIGFDKAFGYDRLERLTTEDASGSATRFDYDATGNRAVQVSNGTPQFNGISATSNRLNSVQDANGVRSIVHDDDGHITSDGINNFVYSDRGRLSSVITPSGIVSYDYNALEQRVAKRGPAGVVPSGEAYFVYDEDGQLLGEYDASGNPIYETVYLGSMPVGVLKRTGAAANSTLAVGVFNVSADHLNTPRVVTQQSDQRMLWRWDGAAAFGDTAAVQNPTGAGEFSFNQRFPGQVFDAETGLMQNWWRDYDPRTGRYTQSDPIGLAGGANTYAYVNGDPVSRGDPRGLDNPRMGDYGGFAGRAPQIELDKVDPMTLLPRPGYQNADVEPPLDAPGLFPGPDACGYYSQRCNESCGEDKYACEARKCCESFGSNFFSNCTRKCLIDQDSRGCSSRSGKARDVCRQRAHYFCYSVCFNLRDAIPGGFGLFPPAACKRAADSIGGMW